MIASIQSDSLGDTLYPIRHRYIFSHSQLVSHASFDTQISGPYHACTTINAQVIIGFNERKQGKYRMNFAMSLNIVYISRLLIIDQFTWRAQHLRLRMQRESLVPLFSFSLSFLCLLFFFSLFIQRLLPSLFLYWDFIFLFPVIYNFFTLVKSMLLGHNPHRRLFSMIMSVCNRTK